MLELINNYEQSNVNLAEENLELKAKNNQKIEDFNAKILEKEGELKEVEDLNKELLRKNENLKAKLENERRNCEQAYEKKVYKLNENIGKLFLKFTSIANEKCNKLGDSLKNNLNTSMKNIKSHLNELNSRIAMETGELFNIDMSLSNGN